VLTRLGQIRRWVGAFCVTIALLFCAQSTLVLFDRIEHQLDIQHDARSLAGTLIVDANDHDHHDGEPDHGAAHEHVNDVATMIVLSLMPLINGIDPHPIVRERLASQSMPLGNFSTLDRPPKA